MSNEHGEPLAANDASLERNEVNFHERNEAMYAPVLALRTDIAERWAVIAELMKELSLHREKKFEKKIIERRATVEIVQKAIHGVLEQNMVRRPKAIRLISYIDAVHDAIQKIIPIRNDVVNANMALAGGFLKKKKRFMQHYRIDRDDGEQLVTGALTRAVETWDPELGTLGTYAEIWMRRALIDARPDKDAPLIFSLDAPRGKSHNGKDVNLHGIIHDEKTVDSSDEMQLQAWSTALREIIANLPDVERLIARMRWLSADESIHDIESIARILNERHGKNMSTKSARQYLARAIKMVTKQMHERFGTEGHGIENEEK